MFSYFDPHTDRTQGAFDHALEALKNGEFNEKDVESAKLEVFSAMDSPVSPSEKGLDRLLNGTTDDERQIQRNRMFAVNTEQVVEVAKKWLQESPLSRVIIGTSESAIDFKNRNDWTVSGQ
eukprot:TRINITY_DN1414_c1_g1_i4.p1 TRINITY_DN1414_c1_g1~~TRINITY_DN1414_c1_g1_i4.p1  ORF type:complete len:121 (+),score=46.45 TRINITY_DN1414_c1_g1_i4:697-1059(+)